jgi:organic hydroperoxide reductase OsmC/OhrA
MSTYYASISWARGRDEFSRQHYSRGHTWGFDEGLRVPASASPHVVKAPWAVTKAVDPEEAFVAAISSCHMLFFLSYVSRDGFIAESYEDAASGVLEKAPSGKVVMTQVTLRPVVTFSGTAPTQAQVDAWHHRAHEECYIANSVTSEVRVEGSFRAA